MLMLQASPDTGASCWGSLPTEAESIPDTPSPQPRLPPFGALLCLPVLLAAPGQAEGTPPTRYVMGVELDVVW